MGLRIGSLNVWAIPEPFAEDVLPRMRAIAAELSALDLDVLLMQEVWSPSARQILVEGGLRAGFDYHFASTAPPGGGLLLLSRHPVTSPRFQRFAFRGDLERVDRAEYLGGKGLLTARIETPAGPVSVVDTHLHARYRQDRPELDSAVRTAQVMEIVDFVNRTEGPVIAAGDLNCEPGDPEFQIFSDLTGMLDVAEGPAAQPTISRSNYYKSHRNKPDRRIDFIFVRDGAGVGLQPVESWRIMDRDLEVGELRRPASDHYGVAVEVEILHEFAAPAVAAGNDPIARRRAGSLARELLALGRAELERREQDREASAGVWAAGAIAAVAASRSPLANRRRFLKRMLLGAGVVALAPAAGFTTVARIDVPDQVRAFDQALEIVDRLDPPVVASLD